MAQGMEVKFSITEQSCPFSAIKASSCMGLLKEYVMRTESGAEFNLTALVNKH